MALADRWNQLRQNIGKLLLNERFLISAHDWMRGPSQGLDPYKPIQKRTDLILASVVAPFVQWKMRVYPDARLALRRRVGDEYEVVAESPFLDMLANPNPDYDFVTMMQATIMELDIDGNSFWLKERTNAGKIAGLFWVPRTTIQPDDVFSKEMGEPYYAYSPNNYERLPVAATDVVHHRFGIDPRNWRLGLSPLGSAMREVMTDELAARHTAALLLNFATPSMLISISSPSSKDDLLKMEKRWKDKVGGDNVGTAVFVNSDLKAETITTSPKDMELAAIRYLTEERVSSLLGVPAIVAGTGAGLRHATYANFDTAQRTVWLNTALPALREFAAALTRQLLPDFDIDMQHSVYFDTTHVAALQEDTERKSTRLISEFQGGLITRAEARMDMGRVVAPEDEMYFGAGAEMEMQGADG